MGTLKNYIGIISDIILFGGIILNSQFRQRTLFKVTLAENTIKWREYTVKTSSSYSYLYLLKS